MSETPPADVAAWFGLPRASGLTPVVEPRASSFEEMLDLCAAGIGVNIAGATAAYSYARPDVRFVPIVDLPDVTTYLVTRHGQHAQVASLLAGLATAEARSAPGATGL